VTRRLPDWARWPEPTATTPPWTVGIEEEVMLLEPEEWRLAARIDDVLLSLPPGLAGSVAAETHASTIELATAPHERVGEAVRELAGLRGRLNAVLGRLGLRAAAAGTHPAAEWRDVRVSEGARYQAIAASMRSLAQREPTFATHVHVAVPDPELAVAVLGRIRRHLPVLLALSANSPFLQGRESGLASARTPLFGAFPRSGLPRRFAGYAEYVEAIDLLLRLDAFPDPTFLWWDVRLQPRFGTIEVRIMDAQTHVGDVAALASLVQCLVRHESGRRRGEPPDHPELLEENRFLAARDGMRASLLDPRAGGPRPVRELLEELLEMCAPDADALGCRRELEQALELAAAPGEQRQRAIAALRPGEAAGGRRLRRLTRQLSATFAQSLPLSLA
jgi:glutamate---cysteine ligase / carboxylate-amine ligase